MSSRQDGRYDAGGVAHNRDIVDMPYHSKQGHADALYRERFCLYDDSYRSRLLSQYLRSGKLRTLFPRKEGIGEDTACLKYQRIDPRRFYSQDRITIPPAWVV